MRYNIDIPVSEYSIKNGVGYETLLHETLTEILSANKYCIRDIQIISASNFVLYDEYAQYMCPDVGCSCIDCVTEDCTCNNYPELADKIVPNVFRVLAAQHECIIRIYCM